MYSRKKESFPYSPEHKNRMKGRYEHMPPKTVVIDSLETYFLASQLLELTDFFLFIAATLLMKTVQFKLKHTCFYFYALMYNKIPWKFFQFKELALLSLSLRVC